TVPGAATGRLACEDAVCWIASVWLRRLWNMPTAGERLLLARFVHAAVVAACPFTGVQRTSRLRAPKSEFDPKRCAPGSWQRIGGESPSRGRFSQPPKPRVM